MAWLFHFAVRLRAGTTGRLLLATFLLAGVCAAVTKSPPDLSGTWKLNRSKSTANPRFLKDDTLVITQSGDKLRFDYYSNGKPTGTEKFRADDVEHDRYTTRIERAYSRVHWEQNGISVRTRHVFDALGYQAYFDTDRWVLSNDRKTLTEQLSDGTLVVYDWAGPAPRSLEDVVEFHAMAVNSGNDTNATDNPNCEFEYRGALQGNILGTGTYQMCLVPEEPEARVPHGGDDRPPASNCSVLSGNLAFVKENKAGSINMKVAGRFCSANQTFLGTYDIEPGSASGDFLNRVVGGSGTLEFSRTSFTVLLNGLLVYH